MPTFIIERELPGASTPTHQELADIAAKSNEVVAELGVPYTWVTSYVAGDKLYCVHETDEAGTILEHARRGGFPADLVTEVGRAALPGLPMRAAGSGHPTQGVATPTRPLQGTAAQASEFR